MQWINKCKSHVGEERTTIVFAWSPIECNRGHKHWLEKVKVRQFWGSYSGRWQSLSINGAPGIAECYCPSWAAPIINETEGH